MARSAVLFRKIPPDLGLLSTLALAGVMSPFSHIYSDGGEWEVKRGSYWKSLYTRLLGHHICAHRSPKFLESIYPYSKRKAWEAASNEAANLGGGAPSQKMGPDLRQIENKGLIQYSTREMDDLNQREWHPVRPPHHRSIIHDLVANYYCHPRNQCKHYWKNRFYAIFYISEWTEIYVFIPYWEEMYWLGLQY